MSFNAAKSSLCALEIVQAAETRSGGLHKGRETIVTIRAWRAEIDDLTTNYDPEDVRQAVATIKSSPALLETKGMPRTLDEIEAILAERVPEILPSSSPSPLVIRPL